MKKHFWLLSGALLLVAPSWAHNGEHHTTGHTNTHAANVGGAAGYSAAQSTWKEVREQTQDLDGLIAARKFEGVHDAALGLRDTVRELRFGWEPLAEADRTKVDLGIRKIDSLLDDLHESADNNNPVAVARDQRTLHMILDQIALSFPSGILNAVGPVTVASSARDPYCRMVVDPATAAARVVVDGQTYYFCSANEAKVFEKNPAPYVALYDELAFGKPRVFSINVAAPGKIAPARPARIAFSVHEKGQKALTTKFQLVHEKLMHLIVVNDDLSWFAHEHPQLAKNGRFTIQQTFPRDGRYYLYSDFTPADGVNQVLRSELRVGSGMTRAPQRLLADKTLVKTVDGVTVNLKLSSPLQAGRQSLLTYSLSKSGRPLTNMTPYLGAMGHMMAISQSGQQVVHTHTVSAGTDPETGLTVVPAMATSSGPSQTFKLQLPTGGLYRVWAQFGARGRIITIPFTFAVRENPANPKPISAMAMAHNRAVTKQASMEGSGTKAPQQVTIALPGGYKTGAATVKAGQPVALTFVLKNDAGCGNTVSVPVAQWTKSLTVGEQVTLMYTPKESGELDFQCGMGMYRGTVIVK